MAYLSETVVPYVNSLRQELQNLDLPAVIIWDCHASHFDPLTAAFAAQNGITLLAIPPHSSHLVQPIDRQFFKKVKQFYSFYTPRPDLDKIAATILRVVQSIESAAVMSVIVKSWEMAGIRAIVENREVVRVVVDPSKVVDDEPEVEEMPAHQGARTTRPTDACHFGVLNEDEQMFLEAGLCPFCQTPLAASG